MSRNQGVRARPKETEAIGGRRASAVFVLMLVAFVAESQLTQYVESTLNYRKPYFLLYIAHSSLSFIFPLHLLYLRFATPFPVKAYLRGLSKTANGHLTTKYSSIPSESNDSAIQEFPRFKYLEIISWCTVGITAPALLWFAALNYASVSDVTAIWNSNAFWAYVISVKLKNLVWQPMRLLSVIIASLGVFVVVYGSKQPSGSSDSDSTKAPLFGNMLTLVASVGYGFYQVLYNMYAVPPSEAEDDEERDWRRLSISTSSTDEALIADEGYEAMTIVNDTVYPPPFGLYANALTTGIGIITVSILWIPLPILHMTSVEPFALPSDLRTFLSVCGIGLSALVFLATFMILLGVWGPIITSVGNLLTIVLVIISDIIFGNALDTLTMWTIVGSSMIVSAFAALAYESIRSQKSVV